MTAIVSVPINHAVSAQNQLLITLRYYATGSFLRVSADFTGVDRSTSGRIMRRVSQALATLRPHFIKFPTTAEEVETVRAGFYQIAKFPRCIGAIDCTYIKIRSPGGNNAELYRNRKQFFSINVQTICDSNLQIQNIVCRWPGSAHDANIFKNSMIRSKFELGLMERYNESQIRTRNPIERSYGVWKRRFPILAIGINVDLEIAKTVIVATAVLHNIANTLRDKTIIINPQLEQDVELINHVPVDRIYLVYFQTKWRNMSAESLRHPITECLRQVDGNISNTQEST
ncbi:hypothetical protein AGLY_003167 [Aphis glycines]|uniref:DDE Tnp4 domain-containing protein n=1 Tax=Aphis glycines TaxID=307491 RepID=A0A6G0U4V6_APHGL|nr:hypothetical protein AGLY_003167 [Aphis glycines]